MSGKHFVTAIQILKLAVYYYKDYADNNAAVGIVVVGLWTCTSAIDVILILV